MTAGAEREARKVLCSVSRSCLELFITCSCISFWHSRIFFVFFFLFLQSSIIVSDFYRKSVDYEHMRVTCCCPFLWETARYILRLLEVWLEGHRGAVLKLLRLMDDVKLVLKFYMFDRGYNISMQIGYRTVKESNQGMVTWTVPLLRSIRTN